MSELERDDMQLLLEVIGDLRDQLKAQQWQPMDTAPKGRPFGEKILFLYDNGEMASVHYVHYWKSYVILGDSETVVDAKPTHWMPLPGVPR